MRVHVEPTPLRWARERAGISDPAALSQTFPKLQAWEAGDADPTLKQLERFARAVHVLSATCF
jgi:hypothetical protein